MGMNFVEFTIELLEDIAIAGAMVALFAASMAIWVGVFWGLFYGIRVLMDKLQQ
jgi:hypothetical protein